MTLYIELLVQGGCYTPINTKLVTSKELVIQYGLLSTKGMLSKEQMSELNQQMCE